MRKLYLKNMVGASIVGLVFLSGVSIACLTFSAVAIAKINEQSSEAPSSNFKTIQASTANVQNRLLRLLEAREEYTLPDKNPMKIAKGSEDFRPTVVLTKDSTANVEKRLMWLIEAPEEYNPPDGNPNFPQMMPEADMPDEMTDLPTDELTDLPTDEMVPEKMRPETPAEEDDSHINETADTGATPVSFERGTMVIKSDLISSSDEDPKPAPPVNPYDPANEGDSKGGRHKGQHLHQQKRGVHLIPIIRMGETAEGSSGLTVIKPWNN